MHTHKHTYFLLTKELTRPVLYNINIIPSYTWEVKRMPQWASEVLQPSLWAGVKTKPSLSCSVPGHETRAGFSVEPGRAATFHRCWEVEDCPTALELLTVLSGTSAVGCQEQVLNLPRQGRRFSNSKQCSGHLAEAHISQTLEITSSSLPDLSLCGNTIQVPARNLTHPRRCVQLAPWNSK